MSSNDGTSTFNLVDSSGWIEYLSDGDNAGIYAEPLTDVDNLIVPSVCIYEVFQVTLRRRSKKDALHVAALMTRGREIPLTSSIALEAATLAHERSLAMADGIILATAQLTGATLWTQDSDFEGIPHVRYISKILE